MKDCIGTLCFKWLSVEDYNTSLFPSGDDHEGTDTAEKNPQLPEKKEDPTEDPTEGPRTEAEDLVSI